MVKVDGIDVDGLFGGGDELWFLWFSLLSDLLDACFGGCDGEVVDFVCFGGPEKGDDDFFGGEDDGDDDFCCCDDEVVDFCVCGFCD